MSAEPGSKLCPRCAEAVKAAALVCRHCNYVFGSPVTPPTTRAKSYGRIIAAVAGLMLAAFVVFVILEAASDTQYYASSIGMSISECRTVQMKFGVPHQQAEEQCSRRVPKKK